MSKEGLQPATKPDVIEVTTPSVMPPLELFQGDREEWQRRWQDADFILSFPASMYRLVSERPQISEIQQEETFSHAFPAFAETTLNRQMQARIGNIRFTETGQLIHTSKQSTADSLATANLGSLLLWGFGRSRKDFTNAIIANAFADVKSGKRHNLHQTLFDLVTINSSTRKWIEANNLDQRLGFSWDDTLPELTLSIQSKSTIPNAVRFCDKYAPRATVAFLDYICQKVGKTGIRNTNLDTLSAFMSSLGKLDPSFFDEDPNLFPKVQENLMVLKKLINQLYEVKK